MKLVVFTTNTPHHLFFVRELQKRYPIHLIINETGSVKAKFETSHPFERERDEWEVQQFFKGSPPEFKNVCDTLDCENINDKSVELKLKEEKPDVVVVFGTRKIHPHIIDTCPNGMINLHGGDPERYRGLDSHLWAIYHKKFDEIITTIHKVNLVLDDGDYLYKLPIKITQGMSLMELRKANTEICIELTILALDSFRRLGKFLPQKQKVKGKYYSFMPVDLKSICIHIFKDYTSGL